MNATDYVWYKTKGCEFWFHSGPYLTLQQAKKEKARLRTFGFEAQLEKKPPPEKSPKKSSAVKSYLFTQPYFIVSLCLGCGEQTRKYTMCSKCRERDRKADARCPK